MEWVWLRPILLQVATAILNEFMASSLESVIMVEITRSIGKSLNKVWSELIPELMQNFVMIHIDRVRINGDKVMSKAENSMVKAASIVSPEDLVTFARPADNTAEETANGVPATGIMANHWKTLLKLCVLQFLQMGILVQFSWLHAQVHLCLLSLFRAVIISLISTTLLSTEQLQ